MSENITKDSNPGSAVNEDTLNKFLRLLWHYVMYIMYICLQYNICLHQTGADPQRSVSLFSVFLKYTNCER